MRRTGARDGFTLIELLIVVMIIGILSAIALTRYGTLMRKAKEGELKGNLGTLRSAVSIYYADMEGEYPDTLAALTVGGRYLRAIPTGLAPYYHGGSASVLLGTASNDADGWGYNNVTGDIRRGGVFVNCTHTDSIGSAWGAY